MTFKKVHRKDHQQRAERLEARFSPTWTGDPTLETATVLPNSPVPAPAASRPVVTPAKPATVAPAPAKPITTPAVVVPSTTAPIVASPVVATSNSPPPSVIVPPSPSSSSSSVVVKTTPAIVATPTSKPAVLTTPTSFRSLPLSSLTPATISSASPSATSAVSSGMATGSIVGIAAASVAGVAVVGAVGIWLLKRYFNSRDQDDPNNQFQRHSWMRNSVALPDDVPSPLARGPSENPRPPTMIERKQTHNFSNVAASRGAYPQDNVGMAYSDHQDPYGAAPMPSFSPGQHFGTPSPNSAQAFFSPIASPPPPGSPGAASFDETMPAMQHASYNTATGVPIYFSRHDSNMSGAQPDSAALPVTPNPHGSMGPDADGYATLDRSSVTPYQAQQYAEISRQLQTEQNLAPIVEAESAPNAAHEYVEHGHGASPFEDPAPGHTEQYQELTLPAPAHPRIDSTPPMLPPMRAMSPVGVMSPVGAHSSFAQLTHAFPAAPSSPAHPAFPPTAAGTPKSPSFKQAPPLSPAVAQRGQVVSVPESVHAGRETPVQFGFNNPAPAEPKAVRRVSIAPSAKRMSVASRKSVAKSGRPETMYDEEDAYGGI